MNEIKRQTRRYINSKWHDLGLSGECYWLHNIRKKIYFVYVCVYVCVYVYCNFFRMRGNIWIYDLLSYIWILFL